MKKGEAPAVVTPAALMALVRANRSCRRFVADRRLTRANLAALVNTARLAASGGNRQPLRYRLVWERAECADIFPLTHWAGQLGGWRPTAEEQPTAYIVVLAEKAAGPTPQADAGIAMQTLLLAATTRGWAGCVLGSVERPAIKFLLRVPEELDILYLVALGYPAETPRLHEARSGNVDYYRDAAGRHHVPKLPLTDVLVQACQSSPPTAGG